MSLCRRRFVDPEHYKEQLESIEGLRRTETMLPELQLVQVAIE